MISLKSMAIMKQIHKRQIILLLSVAWLVFGIVVSYIFCKALGESGYILADPKHPVSISETGNIGDFIGGVVGTIFSLVSVVLLILTLTDQFHQNKLDSFGQTFYEMLHIHNDNITSMSLKDSDNTTGRDAFSKLVSQYEVIYDMVQGCFNNILLINSLSAKDNEDQKDKLGKMKTYLKSQRKAVRLCMRIAYGFFFYGSEKFLLKSNVDEENQILEHVKHLLVLSNSTVKPHNVVLGHYYRHMYQMLRLVERANFLDEDEKYVYAKQLRAQLNDDEQVLLYYNSLSDIGRAWIEGIGQKKRNKMCLMARFRMIKNIPYYKTIKGIQPEELFKKEIESYKVKNQSFFEVERNDN